MHIVFVLPIGEYYSQEWTGAIATVTRHLARELGAEGHRVTVLTPDDGGTSFAEGDVERLPHGSAHPTPTLLRKANSATARLRGWTWPDYGPYLRAVERRLRSLDGPVDAVVVANDPGTADRLAEAASRGAPCCGCTTASKGPRPGRSRRWRAPSAWSR